MPLSVYESQQSHRFELGKDSVDGCVHFPNSELSLRTELWLRSNSGVQLLCSWVTAQIKCFP